MTIIKSKKSNLKVIALIKTFSGEEWLYPCLNSIYDYMTKIVMVHSLVSWTGIKADRVRPAAAQWKAEYDREGKLVEITVEEKDQWQQCDIGYQYIKKNFLCDYVMLVDLDEIWEKEMLDRAFARMRADWRFSAYRCKMWTYIKYPLIKIWPPDPVDTTVFVLAKMPDLGMGFRGRYIEPSFLMRDVYFHHFNFVRRKMSDILDKFNVSHGSEGLLHESWQNWLKIWKQLPHRQDFQPARGFEKNWRYTEIIGRQDLPESVRGMADGNWGK